MPTTSLSASRYPIINSSAKYKTTSCMLEFIYLVVGALCCCFSCSCSCATGARAVAGPHEQGYISDSSESPTVRDSDSDDD